MFSERFPLKIVLCYVLGGLTNQHHQQCQVMASARISYPIANESEMNHLCGLVMNSVWRPGEAEAHSLYQGRGIVPMLLSPTIASIY